MVLYNHTDLMNVCICMPRIYRYRIDSIFWAGLKVQIIKTSLLSWIKRSQYPIFYKLCCFFSHFCNWYVVVVFFFFLLFVFGSDVCRVLFVCLSRVVVFVFLAIQVLMDWTLLICSCLGWFVCWCDMCEIEFDQLNFAEICVTRSNMLIRSNTSTSRCYETNM
jgi:hypothetical protein